MNVLSEIKAQKTKNVGSLKIIKEDKSALPQGLGIKMFSFIELLRTCSGQRSNETGSWAG